MESKIVKGVLVGWFCGQLILLAANYWNLIGAAISFSICLLGAYLLSKK